MPSTSATTTSGAAPAAAPSTAPGPVVDPESLVYRIDIILLIVILVFAAFNAPRAIARFARRAERVQGHLLYSTKLTRRSRTNLNTNSMYLHSDPQKTALDLDGGSTENAHSQFAPYFPSQTTHVDEKALPPRPLSVVVPVSLQQTWHMPMLSSLIPPVARLLQRRTHDNSSFGQVLLMAAYSIVMLYATLYQSNPLVNYDRAGWVGISQLPFIYILATKNNMIGTLVGIGYEKLNYLHRLAGSIAVLVINVHTIGYLYKWSINGTIAQNMSKSSNMHGFIALMFVNMLSQFSTQSVRLKSYNLFYVTHVVGAIALLVSVCFHHTAYIPYVIVASVFYSFDHLVRVIKTRITTATLRPIPELGLTRVEMPSINAGWRAGQHVRLRVLSTAMGILGMIEVHPFTIASVSETEEGLVLLCKKTGKWTSKMYEIANTSVYGDQGRELGRGVKVMVEGPYGGVGNTVTSSYSGALFIIGGSGVTYALSAVQELVRSGHASDVTDIDIVWSIADPASLTPMIPLFTALIAQSTAARLRVAVSYTRASTRSLEGLYLPPGITLAPGRPNIDRHLDALVSATLTGGGCSGVFVGVCGPVSLAGSVCEAVRRFDPGRRSAVGGIECHEEVFGW